MNQEDTFLEISFPYHDNETIATTVARSTNIATIFNRASPFFSSIPPTNDLDYLVSLIDGTFQFADPNKPLSVYNISPNPKLYIIPHQIEFTLNLGDKKTVSLIVNSNTTVVQILEEVHKKKDTVRADAFVLQTPDNIVLIREMSIPEQIPGLTTLNVVDRGSEEVQLNFMDLYLRGPVYLPISEAITLSAYLLQAWRGPYRCFHDSVQTLYEYLPGRFKGIPGAADDLKLEWSFLSNTTRQEATQKFTENVQLLPLFNCTSFSSSKIQVDDSTPLTDLELIYTTSRIIFLDYNRFQTRLSILYDDILCIKKDDETIEIHYSEDGCTKHIIKIETETIYSLFSKTVEKVGQVSEENINSDEEKHRFRKKGDIYNDKKRPPRFPTGFIYDFIAPEGKEKEGLVSSAELMHALVIRASACAFHLDVLLHQVNANNAIFYEQEIIAYYSRLIAYLTYLTYDHRPFDSAWEVGKLLPYLSTEFSKAAEIIDQVVQLLKSAQAHFEAISTDPLYIASRHVVAYTLAHLFSYLELPYAASFKFELLSSIVKNELNSQKDSSEIENNDNPNKNNSENNSENTENVGGKVEEIVKGEKLLEEIQKTFEPLVHEFFDKIIGLKELIGQYLFSLGDIELKKEMQAILDTIFRSHLQSITLLPPISKASIFHDVDPSIIMHQDSCNNVIASVLEFSKLLWEDKKQLDSDRLAAFLDQAAELCSQIINKINMNSIIVKTINQFAKIVEQNLPGLPTYLQLPFHGYLSSSSELSAIFERVSTFQQPLVCLKLLRVASYLIISQPVLLSHEAFQMKSDLLFLVQEFYKLAVNDVVAIELLADEVSSNDICALKCYIEDSTPSLKKVSETNPGSKKLEVNLIHNLFPLMALQFRLNRNITIAAENAVDALLIAYVSGVQSFALALFQFLNNSKNSNQNDSNDQTDKAQSEKSEKIDEYSILQMQPELYEKLGHSNNAPEDIMELTSLYKGLELEQFLPVPKTHEEVRIQNDAVCWLNSTYSNHVYILLNSNKHLCSLQFPYYYLMMNIALKSMHNISLLNGYYNVPIYRRRLVEFIPLAVSEILDIVKSNSFKFQALDSLRNIFAKLERVTKHTSLISIYPLQDFGNLNKITDEIVTNSLEKTPDDFATLMRTFRIARNELMETIEARDKKLILYTLKKIASALTLLITAGNRAFGRKNLEDNTFVRPILAGFSNLLAIIPKAYTYKLGTVIVRDALEPLETTVELLVEEIANSLYKEIDQAAALEEIQSTKAFFEKLDQNNNSQKRKEFSLEFLQLLEKIDMKEDEDLPNIIVQLCQLLIDAEIGDLMDISETIGETEGDYDPSKNELVKLIVSNEYSKTALDVENTVAIVNNTCPYIWYHNLLATFSHEIHFNYDKAIQNFKGKNISEILKKLQNFEHVISSYSILNKIEGKRREMEKREANLNQIYNSFKDFIQNDTSYSGYSLIYKDAADKIGRSFYDEYKIQDWDISKFESLTKTLLSPLTSEYTSTVISNTLLSTRRHLRSLRLLEKNAGVHFLVETERMLNRLEALLRDTFADNESRSLTVVERQKVIIDGYGQSLSRLNDSQVRNFVIHLMQNLSLGMTTFSLNSEPKKELDDISSSLLSLNIVSDAAFPSLLSETDNDNDNDNDNDSEEEDTEEKEENLSLGLLRSNDLFRSAADLNFSRRMVGNIRINFAERLSDSVNDLIKKLSDAYDKKSTN